MLNQAIILCGGLGTRLGDLTRETPKPLLPVGGRPFLEHLVQEVARFGVTDIILLAGRFGGKVSDVLDGRRLWGASIRVLVEPSPLGTGGALKFAEHALDDAFFVLNGDSWIDADLVEAALQWAEGDEHNARLDAQMLLRHVPDARRYGSVLYKEGLVSGFSEKQEGGAPSPALVNAGVYILRKSLVAALEPHIEISLERDVFPELARNGKMAGHLVSGERFFIDIGIPDDYLRAQTEVPAARRRPALFLDRDSTLERDKRYAHRPEALEWLPGAREAVRTANKAGYFVFVVTSLGEVARGRCSEDDVADVHRDMQADLFRIGAHIDAFEFCPHREKAPVPRNREACGQRKPYPAVITGLLEAWPVDRGRSLVIGNSESDLEVGRAAGLRAALYDGGSLADLVIELIAD